jgi:predicted dithiol-disulfide oxidoreductase (DUF899 family)
MADKEQLKKEIEEVYHTLEKTRERMKELAKEMLAGEGEIQDYSFTQTDGTPIKLSQLFGDKDDLILIHNMGKSCPYCTLWADGFIGFSKHIQQRAGFVLVNKDDIATQKEFAASRGWNYKTVSSKDSTFNKDMGYEEPDGSQMPGVSAFHKENGKIYRTGKDFFGPGDTYCAIWPMFDLLKDGPNGFEPKYTY